MSLFSLHFVFLSTLSTITKRRWWYFSGDSCSSVRFERRMIHLRQSTLSSCRTSSEDTSSTTCQSVVSMDSRCWRKVLNTRLCSSLSACCLLQLCTFWRWESLTKWLQFLALWMESQQRIFKKSFMHESHR